jgi:general stress protein YciG
MTMAKQNSNSNSKRGFAAMDKDKQREIASKGGKSSGSESDKRTDREK